MRNEKENRNPHQCHGVAGKSFASAGPFGVFYNLVTQSACNDFPLLLLLACQWEGENQS